MPQVDQLSILIGTVMPAAVSLVNQKHWSTQTKTYVGLGLSALAAAGSLYLQGNLNAGTLVSSGLQLYAASAVTFQQFWRPSGIANALEEKTSMGGEAG